MMRRHFLSFYCSILLFITSPGFAQTTLTPAEAEAQKCEDKIANVQRDLLGKYEDSLGELQLTLQKAADLDGALAVRAERQRVAKEQSLSDKDYVDEPKALRALQTQMVTKVRDLTTQLVQETMPRLVEFKKSLTVAGKLDEALNVRSAIERLQNTHVPLVRAGAGTVVSAETLIIAYGADRGRADKTYKGQKITVHGVLAGYRQDTADANIYLLYLTGGTSSGWVQCSLSASNYRFREEKGSFGATSFVITTKDGDSTARVQKGQVVDIRGVCEGFDEVVRLGKCELPR